MPKNKDVALFVIFQRVTECFACAAFLQRPPMQSNLKTDRANFRLNSWWGWCIFHGVISGEKWEGNMRHSLEVYRESALIFTSDRDWLYPLFDFEKFLSSHAPDRSKLLVKDKIVGRAAGLLLVRLDIRHIYAETLSEHGKSVLEHFKIDYDYGKLVPEIGCKTERLLENEWDAENAYQIILARIRDKG